MANTKKSSKNIKSLQNLAKLVHVRPVNLV